MKKSFNGENESSIIKQTNEIHLLYFLQIQYTSIWIIYLQEWYIM